LRRCFSPPASFIQGCLPGAGLAFSLSSTASDSNCRKGIPRSAARDFARRKIASGFSSVVLIIGMLPYLWENRQMPLQNHEVLQRFHLSTRSRAERSDRCAFRVAERFCNPLDHDPHPQVHAIGNWFIIQLVRRRVGSCAAS
jgi:hypothetical protein